MKFTVTEKHAHGTVTYTAIGSRDQLMDAAYDNGALGVTVRPQ